MPLLEEQFVKDPITIIPQKDKIVLLPSLGDAIAPGASKPAEGATKNTTFYQNDAPTGGYSPGDIWFDTNNNNEIYRASEALAWVSVRDGSIAGKITTFRQAGIPTALGAGDIWYDSDDNDKMYRATSAGDDAIGGGEWIRVDAAWPNVQDPSTTKPENNADVTSTHTSNDTTKVNSVVSTQVQPRAESLWKKGISLGVKKNGLAKTGAGTETINAANTALVNASGNGVVLSDLVGIEFDKGFDFIFIPRFEAASSQDAFWGLEINMSATSPPQNGTYTDDHCGFFIEDGIIYASIGEGSGGGHQTRLDISAGITLTNDNVFRIVFTPGVSALFYINDVLKATLTTAASLPNDTSGTRLYIGHASVGVSRTMYFYNNYFLNYTL